MERVENENDRFENEKVAAAKVGNSGGINCIIGSEEKDARGEVNRKEVTKNS